MRVFRCNVCVLRTQPKSVLTNEKMPFSKTLNHLFPPWIYTWLQLQEFSSQPMNNPDNIYILFDCCLWAYCCTLLGLLTSQDSKSKRSSPFFETVLLCKMHGNKTCMFLDCTSVTGGDLLCTSFSFSVFNLCESSYDLNWAVNNYIDHTIWEWNSDP